MPNVMPNVCLILKIFVCYFSLTESKSADHMPICSRLEPNFRVFFEATDSCPVVRIKLKIFVCYFVCTVATEAIRISHAIFPG